MTFKENISGCESAIFSASSLVDDCLRVAWDKPLILMALKMAEELSA